MQPESRATCVAQVVRVGGPVHLAADELDARRWLIPRPLCECVRLARALVAQPIGIDRPPLEAEHGAPKLLPDPLATLERKRPTGLVGDVRRCESLDLRDGRH